MLTRRTSALFTCFCFILFLISISSIVQGNNQLTSEEVFQERKKLAESGEYLHPLSPKKLLSSTATNIFAAATGPSLAEALDIPQAILGNALVSGAPEASAVFSGLGVIQPKRGLTFSLLSSGVAGTSQPEPGTDFGIDGDRVALTLTLNLPEGANRLSFDYNFLSAEFPDFIATIYNDTFTATLTDSNGVREIARASVNSSAFFPAATSSAGGSGFDIFTEDPWDVDTEFGSGLPDAGLTGFRSANVSVEGGETVVLEFSIEDRGDGILDSAVILDNLLVSSFEVVDPNPVFLLEGEIINDPETLALGGERRDAATADGATKVLLRSKTSGFGTVEFCLVDGNTPEDGGFAPLGDSSFTNCVNVPVKETSQGFMAFAVYQTPKEFNRGGDEELKERSLRFRARFTPSTGDTTESEIPFKLVRPPVLLVHGLWSNGATWIFPLVKDERFSVSVADYEGTNASSFADNLFVPFLFIRKAVTSMRLKNIAATRVDIAGHSMGGILARNHVGSSLFKRGDNFNAGDLHKLVTLNTPHAGSPLGNLCNSIRSIPIVGPFFEGKMVEYGHPVHLGALDDLAIGSAAINAIQHTPVPSHALVGVGGAVALQLIPGKIGAMYTLINYFADTSDLFQQLQHDGVVGRESQEGGMPVNAMTIFNTLDSIHTFVPGSANYSSRLAELFNHNAEESLFAEFPAPQSLTPLVVSTTRNSKTTKLAPQASLAVLDVLEITSPLDGTSVVRLGNCVKLVSEKDEKKILF